MPLQNPEINPAYVEWVTMVKDGEEKPVHPGNVAAHEQAGWVRADQAAPGPAAVPAAESALPAPPVSAETEEGPAEEETPPPAAKKPRKPAVQK